MIGLENWKNNLVSLDLVKLNAFFLLCNNGDFFNEGYIKSYISKVTKGAKIGIFVDMYWGNLKFFINNID